MVECNLLDLQLIKWGTVIISDFLIATIYPFSILQDSSLESRLGHLSRVNNLFNHHVLHQSPRSTSHGD